MEATPIYQQPAFLVFAASTLIAGVSAIIGFTVWLIRQESKLAHSAEKVAQIESETAGLWKAIEDHKEKENLHFNQSVARQVEEKQTARFARLEEDVRDIKMMVRELSKR